MSELLKKAAQFFPASNKTEGGNPSSLLMPVLTYIGANLAAWLILVKVLAKIPLIGIIFNLAYSLCSLYCVLGLAYTLLKYYKGNS